MPRHLPQQVYFWLTRLNIHIQMYTIVFINTQRSIAGEKKKKSHIIHYISSKSKLQDMDIILLPKGNHGFRCNFKGRQKRTIPHVSDWKVESDCLEISLMIYTSPLTQTAARVRVTLLKTCFKARAVTFISRVLIQLISRMIWGSLDITNFRSLS